MTIKSAAHGTARVSVVAIPQYCNNRLVFLSEKGEYSWAIRDFITGKILRSGDSTLKLSDIEACVTYSEKPVYRSVGRTTEWSSELAASSAREFGAKFDQSTPPSNTAGRWRQM